MAMRNVRAAGGPGASSGNGNGNGERNRRNGRHRPRQAPGQHGFDAEIEGATGHAAAAAPQERMRVSVVIPAHNEAEYLSAALQSVIEQDYPLCCLDCVVVDNASTDGTAQIAEEFARQHGELKVTVVTEPSLGVSRAKNCGARQASGGLLLFLDADSRCTPHLVHDVVTHYHAGCPAGSICIVADSDSPLERGFFALIELGPVLFGIRSQMFYCSRQLFLELGGFDEALQLAEDLEFLRRAQALLSQSGMGTVCHIRTSAIATSPRRLRTLPCHLSIVTLFARWALAFAGIGRKRNYSV